LPVTSGHQASVCVALTLTWFHWTELCVGGVGGEGGEGGGGGSDRGDVWHEAGEKTKITCGQNMRETALA
jgi:hypothetical protein